MSGQTGSGGIASGAVTAQLASLGQRVDTLADRVNGLKV
jgi:hypothetical protein